MTIDQSRQPFLDQHPPSTTGYAASSASAPPVPAYYGAPPPQAYSPAPAYAPGYNPEAPTGPPVLPPAGYGATSAPQQYQQPPPQFAQGEYGKPQQGYQQPLPQGYQSYPVDPHVHVNSAPALPPPAPLVATGPMTGPIVNVDNIVPLTEKYCITQSGQCAPTSASPPYFRRKLLILAALFASGSGFMGYYGGVLAISLSRAAVIGMIGICCILGVVALAALALIFTRRDEKRNYGPLHQPGSLDQFLTNLASFGITAAQQQAVRMLLQQAHPQIRHHVVVWFVGRRGMQLTGFFGTIAQMGTTKMQSHFYQLE